MHKSFIRLKFIGFSVEICGSWYAHFKGYIDHMNCNFCLHLRPCTNFIFDQGWIAKSPVNWFNNFFWISVPYFFFFLSQDVLQSLTLIINSTSQEIVTLIVYLITETVNVAGVRWASSGRTWSSTCGRAWRTAGSRPPAAPTTSASSGTATRAPSTSTPPSA